MRVRFRLALTAMVIALPASAQPPVPRTADGHPDFQGLWESFWLTPLERPDGVADVNVAPHDLDKLKALFADRETKRLAGNLGTDGETAIATEVMQVGGVYRSAQVIDPPDGHIPRTPAALARRTAGEPDGPEGFTRGVRCLTGVGLPPMSLANFDNMHRIVQTADHVVIYSESIADTRIIRMSDPAPALRSMGGVTYGRWEGDTLVLTTTHFDGKAPPGGGARANPLSDDAVIVERFWFASPSELDYRYTVTDPVNYTRPWSGELSWRRSAQRLFETVCHEGNYSLANMLRAARLEEARATALAPKAPRR